MTLVQADGFEIDVTMAGAGPPVVAVHSTGMSRRQAFAEVSSLTEARSRTPTG